MFYHKDTVLPNHNFNCSYCRWTPGLNYELSQCTYFINEYGKKHEWSLHFQILWLLCCSVNICALYTYSRRPQLVEAWHVAWGTLVLKKHTACWNYICLDNQNYQLSLSFNLQSLSEFMFLVNEVTVRPWHSPVSGLWAECLCSTPSRKIHCVGIAVSH